MAVFVRSAMEVPRARAAVEAAGLAASVLDESLKIARDRVAVATMHLGKGLEFRAVAVMARATSRRCTTPSATCCTWRARAPATTCS
jgi:alkylation response protein AidB-like acyl-CoA dehydrogenase